MHYRTVTVLVHSAYVSRAVNVIYKGLAFCRLRSPRVSVWFLPVTFHLLPLSSSAGMVQWVGLSTEGWSRRGLEWVCAMSAPRCDTYSQVSGRLTLVTLRSHRVAGWAIAPHSKGGPPVVKTHPPSRARCRPLSAKVVWGRGVTEEAPGPRDRVAGGGSRSLKIATANVVKCISC